MALYVAISALDSLIQYAWDVRVDWNLFNRQPQYPFLRSELAYKAPVGMTWSCIGPRTGRLD